MPNTDLVAKFVSEIRGYVNLIPALDVFSRSFSVKPTALVSQTLVQKEKVWNVSGREKSDGT